MFALDLSEYDAAETLKSVARLRMLQRQIDAELLQHGQHFAELHPDPAMIPGHETIPGAELGRVWGGPGCPGVAEFTAAEFGAAMGRSAGSAARYLGHALALPHRFPRIWDRVLSGQAEGWKACAVANACLALSEDAAAEVDRRVADIVDTVTPLRLSNIVKAAIWYADPEAARAEAEKRARECGVWIGRTDDHGTTTLFLRAPTGDVLRLETTVRQIADALAALGDTDSLDQRRAKAIGIISDPALTQELLQVATHLTTTQPPDTTAQPTDAEANEAGDVQRNAADHSDFGAPDAHAHTHAHTDAETEADGRQVQLAGLCRLGDINNQQEAAGQSGMRTPEELRDAATGPSAARTADDLREAATDHEGARTADDPRETATDRSRTWTADDLPEAATDPTRARTADLHHPDSSDLGAQRVAEDPRGSSQDAVDGDAVASGPDVSATGCGVGMDRAARRALAVKLAVIREAAYGRDAGVAEDRIGALGKPARPGGRAWRARRGRTVIYTHITDETLLAGGGVARVEGFGPVFAARLEELLGHDQIVVQPVIDLRDKVSVDAYEIPRRIRERVKLAYPVEQFVFGTAETTNSTDLDHIRPFNTTGPPGQTSTENLTPLRRFSHRVKTHGGWQVRRLDDRAVEWTSRYGLKFRVDHTGTHPIADTHEVADTQPAAGSHLVAGEPPGAGKRDVGGSVPELGSKP